MQSTVEGVILGHFGQDRLKRVHNFLNSLDKLQFVGISLQYSCAPNSPASHKLKKDGSGLQQTFHTSADTSNASNS